jgi:predicted  nucleic acid-binding Zn-ribbon protein
VDRPPRVRRGEPLLNADREAQLTLLDVQAADSALDRLAHRRSTLPVLATLATLADRHRELVASLTATDAEIERVEAAVASAESGVADVRAHRRRDQERLDAGRVSSPRELEALQHAIATLAARQEALEDVELAAMEELERLQATRERLEQERASVEAEAAAATAERDAAFAELDAEAASETERRTALAAGLPADLLARYETVRAKGGGVGAAALRGGRCEGCRIQLNQAELARVRALPDDAVARCDECGRILVRV